MKSGKNHGPNQGINRAFQEIQEERNRIEAGRLYIETLRMMHPDDEVLEVLRRQERELNDRKQVLHERRDVLTAPVARTVEHGSVTSMGWSAEMDRKLEAMRHDSVGYFRRAREDAREEARQEMSLRSRNLFKAIWHRPSGR